MSIPAVSSASSITFQLNKDACGGTGGCLNGGSAGTVTITDGGTPGTPDNGGATDEVNVNFTLNSGILFSASASKGMLLFNLSGTPTIGIDDLTAAFNGNNTTSDFSIVNGSDPNAVAAATGKDALKASALGSFEYAIICSACQGGQTTNPGGTVSWDVVLTNVTVNSFVANDSGFFFATDVSGFNGNTGNVGANTSNLPELITPEPTSLLLLGSGLVLGAARLRRRKSA